MSALAIALLALVVILVIVLAWTVVKWLFIIAIVLGLVWLILFFWRGITRHT